MSGDWKRGMRMLDRGLYVDENDRTHIDENEMFEASGIGPAALLLLPQARELAHRIAQKVAREMGAELHEWE